jgi:hypothetical protein
VVLELMPSLLSSALHERSYSGVRTSACPGIDTHAAGKLFREEKRVDVVQN